MDIAIVIRYENRFGILIRVERRSDLELVAPGDISKY